MALRPAATGIALGITMVVLFALCALAEMFGQTAQLSHAWINLFTRAPMGTAREWIEGTVSSFVFGGVAGLVFAVIYNAVASRD
jgi:hypothetical protein